MDTTVSVHRGVRAKTAGQTRTCMTCDGCGVKGGGYGVTQSHPRCDPCYTLAMQYLVSIACNISGDRLVRHLMIQIDSINFALDWVLKGKQPGGKTYKSDFAKVIYKAQTGRQPLSSTASKVDRQLFKSFKSRQQNIIRGRNYLLDMYKQVFKLLHKTCLTFFTDLVVSSAFMFYRIQYGTLTISLKVQRHFDQCSRDFACVTRLHQPILKHSNE